MSEANNTSDLIENFIRLAMSGSWLSLNDVSDLFQLSVLEIAANIDAIYNEGELDPAITRRVSSLTVKTRNNHSDTHYNFDVVISLSYRLQSPQAKAVRQNFTKILSGFLIKGFALDDERLKNGPSWDIDVLEEKAHTFYK
jgi:hypothetical protein